ncbi:MAG: hypothetical protein P8N51_16230 [Pseudomonadales bacterium]|nr:hypothetical protein [Pseudomonadales bacterium]MDG1443418.1 hypothetical protein [Pseudomonadales bacterium]
MKKILPSLKGFVEIVAMISVLASLAIVILELSANEKATRSATASDVALSLSDWYTNVGLARVGGTLFRRAMKDPTTLSEDEQADFIFLLHGGILLYQNAFVLGQEGTLDNSLQTVTLGTLSAIVNQPGFQFYWGQRKTAFTNAFQNYVEQLEAKDESALSEVYD